VTFRTSITLPQLSCVNQISTKTAHVHSHNLRGSTQLLPSPNAYTSSSIPSSDNTAKQVYAVYTLQPFVLVSLHGIINIYHVLLNEAKLEIKSSLLTLNSFDYNNNKIQQAREQKFD